MLFIYVNSSQVPNWLHKAASPIVMSLEKHIPQPYAGEIRGIASMMKMNLADVVILNFAYEFTAYVRFHVCSYSCEYIQDSNVHV